jgi:endonuclease/exonuclease/phosphatase family metal-dependent hydrolase
LAWLAAAGLLAACFLSCALTAAPSLPAADGCPALDGLGRPVRLLSWNAQNLFDDQADGNEYPEFVPVADSAQGWNRAAYRVRLERAARVIRESAGLPDVVVLCEVESQRVIDDLLRDFLPAGAYPVAMVQPDPASAIHIALLSRLPLLRARSHAVAVGDKPGRPVWELRLALPGAAGPDGRPRELVLFANHWKSKSGGEAATEALRTAAAACLEREAARIRAASPGVLILACGDFNETPAGAGAPAEPVPDRPVGRVVGGTVMRLLTGGPQAMVRRADGSISLAGGEGRWLSPWDRDAAGRMGSYFYDGEWEAIDNYLLATPDGYADGWPERLSFSTVAADFQLDGDGFPWRWEARTGKGVSDHLPLALELRRRAP